jgi:HK97 family phage major capsid protein
MFEEIKSFTSEQIEKRLSEIKTEIDGADKEKLEELNKEIEALETRKKEIAMEEKRADLKAVAEGAGVVIVPADQKEKRTLESVKGSQEYLEAFANMIKTGSDKECRALLTDLVDGGSVPTPTVIDNFIATAWERANLVSRVRRTTIKGTAKYPFEYSATGASVHTEGAKAPDEEQLVLGTVSVEPEMLKKWITVSDEVLALKGQEFLDYIYDEIEFRILALADAQVVAAIKAAPETATKVKAGVRQLEVASADAFTIFNALAELVSAATNPVAIMNKKLYFNTFMSLADTTGRPIYNVVSENGRPTYYINGVEVIFDNSLDEDELLVGDLDGIIMNLPDGREVSFVTDPYSLAEKDLVKIVGKMYAGIAVVRDGYFCNVSITGASA